MLLAIIASACLALLLAPGRVSAATSLMTEDIPLLGLKSYGSHEAEFGYDIAQQMGAHFVRLHTGRDSTFTFATHMDPFVADARRRGLEPYLTLTYRRRYRDAVDPGFLGVPTPAQFGSWCGEAAARYAGRVHHYGVFNEPNYFGDGLTPQGYNALYRSCYAAIKTAAPSAMVYYGEIAADDRSTDPCSWVSQSLSSSAPTLADGIAIHTYQWTTAPENALPGALCRGIGRLADWTQLTTFWRANNGSLKQPNGARVPIVISEHGYCAPHGECPPGAGSASQLSDAVKADWSRRAFVWAAQHNVKIFSYYHLLSQPDHPSRWDSGLIRNDMSITPAVWSLRSAVGLPPFQPTWKPWEALYGLLADDTGPAATSRTSKTLDIFVTGVDNSLYQRWYADGLGWSEWISHGGNLQGTPTASSWAPGRLDVFARSPSNSLVQKFWIDPVGWSGWLDLGGQIASSPSVTSWGLGRLDVFARGPDSSLLHKFYANGAWSGWQSLGGNLTSAPSAVSWGTGRLDVFARGASGDLVHTFHAGGVWHGWESLGGQLTSAPSAVSWAPNHLDVYVRGLDNGLWHKWWNGNQWQQTFDSLGGTLAGPPAAASWGLGHIDVYVQGTDGALYHKPYF